VRIVFDTNVLLAGVFAHGMCEELLDLTLGDPRHVVITSQYILREFVDRAVSKFGAPADEVRKAARILESQMEMVDPLPVRAGACRDSDDLPILGTGLAAKADCLATGDRHLLELKTFQSIPIITPRELFGKLQ
jgi:uncharacterized protein